MKQCEFEGCGKPLFAKKVCRGHYNQKRKGWVLVPLRQYNRVHDGKKVCITCQEDKSLDEYTPKPDGNPASRCRACAARVETARNRARKKNVGTESTTITGGTE